MNLSNLPVVATSNWDIGAFLQNSTTTLQKWGGYLIALIGVILILVGIVMVAKGIAMHGKTQTNWVVAIAAIIIGGALFAGQWTFVKNIASGGQKTITDLGTNNKDTANGIDRPGDTTK